jgi:hypothetical protein
MNETSVAASTARGVAPWHLWAVGIVSLLWNCYGAYDYTMSHVGGLEFFQSMGFDEEVFAWFQAIPAWATAAWAIGVWVSLVGSVLLLARSRHAATAFLVSLVGAAASFAYQFTTDRPASLEGFGNTVMPVVILIVIALQWYYARRMAAAGVLR